MRISPSKSVVHVAEKVEGSSCVVRSPTLIVTMVPTGPNFGVKLVMFGVFAVGVLGPSSLLQDPNVIIVIGDKKRVLIFITNCLWDYFKVQDVVLFNNFMARSDGCPV